MQIILDTETNSLRDPTKIHFIVCRDIHNSEDVYVFKNTHEDQEEFLRFIEGVDLICGHNLIEYDLIRVLYPLVNRFSEVFNGSLVDTLVLSRLLNFRRPGGHSIESYAREFGLIKVGSDITDWSEATSEMLSRCINDTLVNLKVFKKLERYLNDPRFTEAIRLEHDTAFICADLHRSGFPFDRDSALLLRESLDRKLQGIDQEIKEAFPPKRVYKTTISPRKTKHGTIHRHDLNRLVSAGFDLGDIRADHKYDIYETVEFNPGSVKQIIERLNEAGWKPTEKTKGHVNLTKKFRGKRTAKPESDGKKEYFAEYGWTLSEVNLKTLPEGAPKAARRLSERIILASRIRRLDEWLGLCTTESGPLGTPSIHGQFDGIGTWTHRKATRSPNMQNVPVAKRTTSDTALERYFNDLSDEMRQLWHAPEGYKLLGTDASGIQMCIFAHYVNDKRLIDALINGNKTDGTDIHSLHWRLLEEFGCRGRDPAKTFIYAWLLGAGIAKIGEIFETIHRNARAANDTFIEYYPGLKELKKTRIPLDAQRGYFEGLDGRLVICQSEHETLGGYLQNGESIVMKRACREWRRELDTRRIEYYQVNDVHDEWQTLVPDDPDLVDFVGRTQVQAIVNQGIELKLNCPLNGDFNTGYSWKETH